MYTEGVLSICQEALKMQILLHLKVTKSPGTYTSQ